MPYGLGIDLGTSYTVAATSRAGAGGTGPEVVALGLRPGMRGIPTVLHVADDGTVLVGAAAEPLVLSDPDRVFRGFVHRVGEPSSADPRLRPEALAARLVKSVADTVAQREGDTPQRVTLAHPASWGSGECALVHDALTETGLPDVVPVPAPVAATLAYQALAGTADGDTLAIYDLGATFSASITHQTGDEVVLLGRPQTLADGGGTRFDELVLGRVLDELGDQVAATDLDDQAVLAGMAELLTNCVAAREALGERSEVSIPVALPGLVAEVRLTAAELRDLIDPALRMTVASLRAALSAAEVRPTDLSTILVIGGCAGMPQVTRLLTTELGLPVTVAPTPELTVARGAALLATRSGTAGPRTASGGASARPAPATPTPPPEGPATTPILAELIGGLPTTPIPAVGAATNEAADPPTESFAAHSRPRRRTRTLLATAAGVVAVAVFAVPVALLQAADSTAAPSPGNEQGAGEYPGGPGEVATYGGAGAPLAPASAGDTTAPSATNPAASAPASAALPQPTPALPPGLLRPLRPTTAPPPAPTTTRTPAPTTTSPPGSTTPPSSTTSSTSPPSTTTPTSDPTSAPPSSSAPASTPATPPTSAGTMNAGPRNPGIPAETMNDLDDLPRGRASGEDRLRERAPQEWGQRHGTERPHRAEQQR